MLVYEGDKGVQMTQRQESCRSLGHSEKPGVEFDRRATALAELPQCPGFKDAYELHIIVCVCG